MISEKTNNLSFLKMQYNLQDDNCTNFYMINEVNDKSLDGVDVYRHLYEIRNDSVRKNDFIFRVMQECRDNIWYFFREVVRIPTQLNKETFVDSNLAMFPLTPKSAIMIQLYNNGIGFSTTYNNTFNYNEMYTMLLLILYREFFTIYDNTVVFGIPSSIDEKYEEKSNKKYTNRNYIHDLTTLLYHELMWANNYIIGHIDAISPRLSDCNNIVHSIFSIDSMASINNTTKDDFITKVGNNIFYPVITNMEVLKEFLNYAHKKDNRFSFGNIILDSNNKLDGNEILLDYIFDTKYKVNDNKDTLSLLSTVLDFEPNINFNQLYLI